jgi:hypothetical protein
MEHMGMNHKEFLDAYFDLQCIAKPDEDTMEMLVLLYDSVCKSRSGPNMTSVGHKMIRGPEALWIPSGIRMILWRLATVLKKMVKKGKIEESHVMMYFVECFCVLSNCMLWHFDRWEVVHAFFVGALHCYNQAGPFLDSTPKCLGPFVDKKVFYKLDTSKDPFFFQKTDFYRM